jgi:hypothetical protein
VTSWHADADDLAAYAAGAAPAVVAASVDAHVLGCPSCRRALAGMSDPLDSRRRWARLADAVDRPTPSLLERLGLPGSRDLRRAALAAPAMRWAWASALALVLVIPLTAVLLLGTGARGLAVLLALAPLAPAAAVALAYRHAADPAGELTLATPAAGLRLVAMRAVAVGVAAVPSGTAVGWLAGVPLQALAWLLPGLALAAAVLLAGTTRLDPLMVAALLGGGWALAVVAPAPVRGLAARQVVETVASPTLQLLALGVAVACLLLTAARRGAVAYRRTA